MDEVVSHIHYGEYDFDKRFPLLVVQGAMSSAGYSVNHETGLIERQVCLCHAYSSSECCCSFDWEEEDSDNRED